MTRKKRKEGLNKMMKVAIRTALKKTSATWNRRKKKREGGGAREPIEGAFLVSAKDQGGDGRIIY